MLHLLIIQLAPPVTTASVEPPRSKLKLIKTQLRNRCGERRFSDLLLLSIEWDQIKGISQLTITRSLTYTNTWPKEEFCHDSTTHHFYPMTLSSQIVAFSLTLSRLCVCVCVCVCVCETNVNSSLCVLLNKGVCGMWNVL